MSASNSVICSANVMVKKHNGRLVLTPQSLVWNPSVSGVQPISIDATKIETLFTSKDGSQKVILKVKYGNSETDSQNFTFSNASSAVSDREKFKGELTQMISNNRSQSTPSVNNSKAGSRNASATSSAARSPMPSDGKNSYGDFQVRQAVLKKDQELNDLHRELVRSGQITDEEFWDGREHLIQAEKILMEQKAGKSAQLVDPKPETSQTGEIKIVITQDLISGIFDQFPIVAKIYHENVPNKLNEGAFWKQYFQSKLFNRHQSSARTLGENLKVDPLFDKYLEDEDDDLEPRTLRTDQVNALLNLNSTNEDHQETGNQKDFTMRAGAQRSSLPLIRRFNDYSERLLDRSIGPQKRHKQGIDGGDAGSRRYYDEIELEDLMDANEEGRIILNMQNREEFFKQGLDKQTSGDLQLQKKICAQSHEWNNYSLDLGKFDLDTNLGQRAMNCMYQTIVGKQAASKISKEAPIPDDIMKQMISCQASTNEFLRQFWSAIYTPQTTDTTTSKNRKGAKAERMIEYLKKTVERIQKICETASVRQIDSRRIEEAFGPTQEAVAKAVRFYSEKTRA